LVKQQKFQVKLGKTISTYSHSTVQFAMTLQKLRLNCKQSVMK